MNKTSLTVCIVTLTSLLQQPRRVARMRCVRAFHLRAAELLYSFSRCILDLPQSEAALRARVSCVRSQPPLAAIGGCTTAASMRARAAASSSRCCRGTDLLSCSCSSRGSTPCQQKSEVARGGSVGASLADVDLSCTDDRRWKGAASATTRMISRVLCTLSCGARRLALCRAQRRWHGPPGPIDCH